MAQALLQFQIRLEWFVSLGSQCESENRPSLYGKVFSAVFLEASGAPVLVDDLTVSAPETCLSQPLIDMSRQWTGHWWAV